MPGKFGYRYVYAPVHIENILKKIRETNRPPKVTSTYVVKSWLLKNKQYSACLDILKDMGFIDSSGIPTNLYAQYQGGKHKTILAQGIKTAYKHIFDVYDHANNLPKKELEDYFKTQTGITTSVLDKMVATFTTLCKLADFSDKMPPSTVIEKEKQEQEISTGKEAICSANIEPNIQINIGINIAADTDEKQIKAIFENMKKYLFTKDNE